MTYVDANSLQPGAMIEPLPYKDIKVEDILTLDKVSHTPDNSKTGYMVECDLEFPVELYDKFKEYPPCPGNLVPQKDWASDYQIDFNG